MDDAPLLRTSLNAWHAAHGGRLVPFAGWEMPLQYGSIVAEHHAVRREVGLFDIGHMGRLRIDGPDALAWIEAVTTNHAARLKPGQIQYSLVPNESGGLVDDILVYRRPDGGHAIVCNASNRPAVVAWMQENKAGRDATLTDQTEELAMIAVQGPRAAGLVAALGGDLDPSSLGYYRCGTARGLAGLPAGAEALVSRTGYTGEDGFELIVPSGSAPAVWEALLDRGAAAGVTPCGLAARDTLRFEAAMPLYGHELGPDIDPFEAGLGWAVKLGKGPFVGREALERRSQTVGRARVGLELDGKRIARQHAAVSAADGRPVGAVTSGTFAPTLEKSLAMAFVDVDQAAVGTPLVVSVREHQVPARVVPLPFYKKS